MAAACFKTNSGSWSRSFFRRRAGAPHLRADCRGYLRPPDRPPQRPSACSTAPSPRLMSLGTKVCVISGNHDGAGRMALLKQALSRSGVYFATELSDALTPCFWKRGERLQLFLLPYFDTAQAREFLGTALCGRGPLHGTAAGTASSPV